MLRTRITTCALPSKLWNGESTSSASIFGFSRDALAIEARMAKGVNIEKERTRYSLNCQRIEDSARQSVATFSEASKALDALDAGSTVALTLDDPYLELVSAWSSGNQSERPLGPDRIGASFVPPGSVANYVSKLSSLAEATGVKERMSARFEFLEEVLGKGAGIVEFLDCFAGPITNEDPGVILGNEFGAKEPLTNGQEIAVDFLLEEGTQDWPANWAQQLGSAKRQIAAAIETGQSLNLSNWMNAVISEALHCFVARGVLKSPEPTKVRVVYSDGSEAEPFPINLLSAEATPGTQVRDRIKASLISMRHPEMDRDVDFAWYRNCRASKTRTFAEADEYCYRHSQKLLRQLVAENLDLQLYQTGFAPGVIGFYRALAEQMSAEPGSIRVTPMYKKGLAYEPGTVWE